MNTILKYYLYEVLNYCPSSLYDYDWGSCIFFKVNDISFIFYKNLLVDIKVKEDSLLKKYKKDFIKSLELLNLEKPIKVLNTEDIKDLTIDFEKTDDYNEANLNLKNFTYKKDFTNISLFEAVLFLQPDFFKKEFEIMKENGVDLNGLIEEQKLNNKKFKNFIESNDNELTMKITNDYYKIYKEFHPELPGIYSVYKNKISSSYNRTYNDYIAICTKDNQLLSRNFDEIYFDFNQLSKCDIITELQEKVAEKCYDYFEEYNKNLIENLIEEQFKSNSDWASARGVDLLEYVNSSAKKGFEITSIEDYKKMLKQNILNEMKTNYQKYKHDQLPKVKLNYDSFTKEIYSMYFNDKEKCIDTLSKDLINSYKTNFLQYYAYKYIEQNQDVSIKIKTDLIKIITNNKIKSCNVTLKYLDGKTEEINLNLHKNISDMKEHIIDENTLFIQSRRSNIKYPIYAIEKITRYKQVLFDKNDYNFEELDDKQIFNDYCRCKILTHFKNDVYKDEEKVKKLLLTDYITTIPKIDESLFNSPSFVKYLIEEYSSNALECISFINKPNIVDILINSAKENDITFNKIYMFLKMSSDDYTEKRIKDILDVTKTSSYNVPKILLQIDKERFKDEKFMDFLKKEKLIPIKNFDAELFEHIEDIDILLNLTDLTNIYNQIIKSTKALYNKNLIDYILEKADFEKINLPTHTIIQVYPDNKDIIYKAAKICTINYCDYFYDNLMYIEKNKKEKDEPCVFDLDEDMQIELMDSNIGFIYESKIKQEVKDMYIIGTMCGFVGDVCKSGDAIIFNTEQFKFKITSATILISDDRDREYRSHPDAEYIQKIIEPLIEEMQDRGISIKATNFRELLEELPDEKLLNER